MILPDKLFEWFYDDAFPTNVRLNNMSGGTDIAGCFGIGNPITPVYVGGCSGMSLGISVEVYNGEIEGDHMKGEAVNHGTAGELVATAPFPNQPQGFWGSNGTKRYHDAYFARFDSMFPTFLCQTWNVTDYLQDVWAQGDFVAIHPITKQLLFLGRSDGILNPSGIRFGSAEIYKIIESHFATEVVESLCVGRRRPTDNDEKVFLFLLMRPAVEFTETFATRVKDVIRHQLSHRHVPAFVFATQEIPVCILPVRKEKSNSIDTQPRPDDSKPEKGGAACKADHLRPGCQAIRNPTKSS